VQELGKNQFVRNPLGESSWGSICEEAFGRRDLGKGVCERNSWKEHLWGVVWGKVPGRRHLGRLWKYLGCFFCCTCSVDYFQGTIHQIVYMAMLFGDPWLCDKIGREIKGPLRQHRQDPIS